MPYSLTDATTKLAQSDPAFASIHRRFAEDLAPNDPPMVIVFAFYGRQFAQSVTRGANMVSILQLIEDLMQNGTEDVKNAVATGFWEAILAEASAGRFDFRSIIRQAGSASLDYCRAWDGFTGVRTPGLHDPAT